MDVGEVEAAIRELLPTPPTLPLVAQTLAIGERTLQRRIASKGSSFRQLLDRARMRQAQQWLQSEPLSIADVSRRLGYQDPAHFSRAFRRWTGLSPSEYQDQYR